MVIETAVTLLINYVYICCGQGPVTFISHCLTFIDFLHVFVGLIKAVNYVIASHRTHPKIQHMVLDKCKAKPAIGLICFPKLPGYSLLLFCDLVTVIEASSSLSCVTYFVV